MIIGFEALKFNRISSYSSSSYFDWGLKKLWIDICGGW